MGGWAARVAAVTGVAIALALSGCARTDTERARLDQFLGLTPQPETSAPTAPVGTTDSAASQPAQPATAAVETPPPEPQPAIPGPEIYRGSGPNIAAPSPPDAEAEALAEAVNVIDGGDVTLNFVNADIKEVVNALLGETLGLNFTIDPKVQGAITLRTARPIRRSAVIGVLEDALAFSGAALVQSNGIYEILPIQEAGATPGIMGVSGAPVRMERGFGLHIIPLRYASASSLRGTLESFTPPGRTLRVDEARNLILFVGTGSEAQDITDLVATFDVDWMAGMSFGLFPLRIADPETVTKELDVVFSQGAESPARGMIRFVPVDRLNAILVVTRQDRYLSAANQWISRLDRGEATDKRQLYVYYIQNGRAAELASVLGKVFETAGSEQPVQPTLASLAPGLAPAQLANSTGMSTGFGTPSPTAAPAPSAPSGAAASSGSAAGGSAPGVTEEAASLGTPPAIANGSQTGIRIVADERNNALVIYATPKEYEITDAALKKLDIVPLQVMIEATIAEVTLNDTLQYGLQWFFNTGDSSFTFSDLDTGAVASVFPGFSYVFAGNNVRVVLNALKQITDVRVISSPHLLVLDNEPAQLQVGDQVPIVVRNAVSVTDPEAPVVNEVEYRDTGVILNITPRVNTSGLVVLDIVQEVSDVATTTTSGIDSPTIQRRRISSTVAIDSGETVALGGLIRDSKSNGVTGLPVLSDIPILGNLFKMTTDTVKRTELLVLLTPRVVRSRNDARAVTEELQQRLRAVVPLSVKIQ